MYRRLLSLFRKFPCLPSPQNQGGFALMHTLLLTGLSGGLVLGINQILDQRISWMNLIRTQQRMELIQQRLQNAGQSYSTMVNSAKKHSASPLGQCFLQNSCPHTSTPFAIDLVDGLNRPLSGTFDLNGRPCTKACPLEITTTIAIHCENGVNCSSPSELVTSYRIRKTADAKTLRDLPDIEETVVLSLFTCPAGEYIRAVTDDGVFQCASPEASLNETACPPKTAAYGLDSQGFLECRSVINYCQRPIALATVLDTSGSMSAQNKLGDAKGVLSQLLSKMDSSRDMGSYTRFATQAEVRAPLSSSFSAIKSIIQGENASGATNLSGGLSLAASTLQNDSSREKLILVVSDGFHNVGQTRPVAVAAALKQAGYRIFSIGFSQAADNVTLRQLASPGDYYSADNSAELQAAFTKIADATCR